jgi:hypothetical protein
MSKRTFLIKNILNKLLSEDYDAADIANEKNVTDNETANSSAKAEMLIDKIKSNLSNMGVRPAELDSIYTLDQLKVMGFAMSFKVRQLGRGGFDNDLPPSEEEILDEFANFNGRAKYNTSLSQERQTVVLDLDNGWEVTFDDGDLDINLPSTDESVRALTDGREYKVILGGSYDPTESGNDEESDEDDGTDEKEEESSVNVPSPKDFLKKNRDTQLIHLSKTFTPNGQDLWSKLNLKDGTNIPTRFFDAAIGGGDFDRGKSLEKLYERFVKNGNFKSKVSKENWLGKVVVSNDVKAKVKWVRNTRKNIAGFFKDLNTTFPQFKFGRENKSEISTESITKNVVSQLLSEGKLGNLADLAGFQEKLFLKNLPQFIEMLSMMYSKHKGTQLTYDKDAVIKASRGVKSESLIREEGDETKKPYVGILRLESIELGFGEGGVKGKKQKTDIKGVATGRINVGTPPKDSEMSWWTSNVSNNIQNLLTSGLDVEKSQQNDKSVILVWPNGFTAGDTEAMVLFGDDADWIIAAQSDKGYSGEITIGKKVSGNESIHKDFTAKLSNFKIR